MVRLMRLEKLWEKTNGRQVAGYQSKLCAAVISYAVRRWVYGCNKIKLDSMFQHGLVDIIV